MRGTWLCLLCAGCSFTAGVLSATNDDAATTPDDGVLADDASIDAPVDGQLVQPPDAAIDAPPDARTCPGDFTVLTGGQTMSRYKRYGAPTAMTFDQAQQTCVTAGGFIAVPNDAGELGALEAVAQNGGAPGYWVGITDTATEGAWKTVLGGAATYLPWKPAPNAQPNGGTASNCVVGSANELWDVDCAGPYPFTCECSL